MLGERSGIGTGGPASDVEEIFLRTDTAARNGVLLILGGIATLAVAAVGIGIALLGNVGQLQLHLMTTMPILIGLGMVVAGVSQAKAPRQISVGPAGITIEGRTRIQHAWDDIGWATVAQAGIGAHRTLTLYDVRGKTLASISDAFINFEELVERVKARVDARPDDTAERVRRKKGRTSAIIATAGGLGLLAAAIGIAWMTRHEQRAEKLLREQGTPGTGVIVRRFLAPNGITPRLEYSVSTSAGLAPKRNAEVERGYWDSLEGAKEVPVTYVPSEPSISRLTTGEVERSKKDFTRTPAGGYTLAAAGGLMSLLMLGAGAMQFCGWDIDLDSKSGKLAIKRWGTGQ